jgi:hypothetical protein
MADGRAVRLAAVSGHLLKRRRTWFMATGKESAKQPAEGLKNAAKEVARGAEQDAKTGNVATVKETAAQPADSLPTGTRRNLPAE